MGVTFRKNYVMHPIEMPVTTMPVFRTPIHISYRMGLNLLATFGAAHFDAVLMLCGFTGIQLSSILHPADFLGCDDLQDLSFIPRMNLPSEHKLEFVNEVLGRLSSNFTILTLRQHAQEVSQMSSLAAVEPRFF
jgi:hypothetical protein